MEVHDPWLPVTRYVRRLPTVTLCRLQARPSRLAYLLRRREHPAERDWRVLAQVIGVKRARRRIARIARETLERRGR